MSAGQGLEGLDAGEAVFRVATVSMAPVGTDPGASSAWTAVGTDAEIVVVEPPWEITLPLDVMVRVLPAQLWMHPQCLAARAAIERHAVPVGRMLEETRPDPPR